VGIGESDALEQEIEQIIPRQEDKFPVEVDGKKASDCPHIDGIVPYPLVVRV
jgi:hypothetical protein